MKATKLQPSAVPPSGTRTVRINGVVVQLKFAAQANEKAASQISRFLRASYLRRRTA